MACGERFQWGPLYIDGATVYLPNGMTLNYRNLHQGTRYGRLQWFYDWANAEKVIYGPKLLENFIQALAFVLIMEAARRVKHLTGGLLMPAHQVHDELIYVVPESIAQDVVALACVEIARRPTWLPDVPLAAEGSFGRSYGAAKEAA
jgi:hypothetical protein